MDKSFLARSGQSCNFIRENSMRSLACCLFVGFATFVGAANAADPQSAVYRVQHSLTVSKIPPGSRQVRIWFWLPDDDECQKVLNLEVKDSPLDYQVTRDAKYGHRYLYAVVNNPAADKATLSTEFTLRRNSVSVSLDPSRATPLTDAHRNLFSEYLRRDVPNMEVNQGVVKLANEICGNETNEIKQARLLFDWVTDHTDHYSKGGTAPKSSGKGSVEYCLSKKGGGCTDQHALFIALARARGIPTRLQFGTLLKPANEGKEMDPGYRCWVQFFVPNYGWVPMDIAAANTNPAKRDFYFSGLDNRRVHFSEGRDLDVAPKQDGPRLNLLIIGYVEVDGKPHDSFQRVLKYTEVKNELPDRAAAL
jgi:transglutaminase-like putative cysteine protease